ncbi:MAG: universal stress protein [Bacteroidetes bacterium]|nr:universal stress protein [Bacteroidota bacterium]
MNTNIFLVPTDYSKVADCAINHAVRLAQTLKGEIQLLHVVAKDRDVEENKTKLQKIAADINKASNVKVDYIVRVGNIFDDIGKVASEIKAQLIIMGTHGVKGFQHITGSHALKVITNSKVPFIVVQQRNIREGYSKIVLPLELAKETKQKIAITISMAKYFNSKVYVFSPLETDEYLRNSATRNLNYTKSEMQIHKISFETATAEKSGNFVKQLLHYASKIDADLITMLNIQDIGLTEFIAGPDEQQVITNETQIPVLCMNPVNVTVSGGSILFS